MRRIAFIAHLSEVSGSGVALLETVSAFAADCKVYLILPGNGPLADRAVQRGIEPVIISNAEVAITEAGIGRKLALVASRLRYVWRLRQFFRQNKISLVYINTSASVFPALAAKQSGLPIAWHIHETLDADDRRTRWKRRIIQRWASGLIYASSSGMEFLPPPAATPTLIARNYIQVQNLAPLGKERTTLRGSLQPHQPVIMMNGTIRRKGADMLLQAAQLLRGTFPELDFRVVITGMPPAEPAFAALLTELEGSPELRGRVSFPGMQESLIPLLSTASIFVSPARNEALPIAIVEAMAAGVPIISTDVGDCAELLDNGRCGWIVAVEDPEALAAAINEALAKPQLSRTRAEAAYGKALELYGSEDFWNPLKAFLACLK